MNQRGTLPLLSKTYATKQKVYLRSLNNFKENLDEKKTLNCDYHILHKKHPDLYGAKSILRNPEQQRS